MFRGAFRVVAVLAVLGLVIGSLAVPSSASSRAGQVQGIDEEKIQLVGIVPDLDKLIARGIQLSGLNTQAFMDRLVAHTDAYGPIRGREVEWIRVAWDPQDSTSFDAACTQAVLDNKPFVVINSSGFRDSAIPCVVVDNKTPYMSGDMMPRTLQDAAGKNLVSLALPPEVAGVEGVRFIDKNKLVDKKTAKVGILSNNIPGVKSAADAAEKEFKKRGYDAVSKVEVNGLASDATILRREVGQAATTFQALGVDTVFNVQSMTQTTAFWDEGNRANYKPKMFAVDGQGQACTANGAAGIQMSHNPDLTCITAFDGRAEVDGNGIRQDNEFEAECRANFEAKYGFKTTPGQRSGGVTVNGVKYTEDLTPNECTILELLLPAIEKAGKNPTWPKVYKNIMAVESGPAAYASNGEGGFGPNKPYYYNQIHAMKWAGVDANAPKAANGTYNGCPTVISCYTPLEFNGQEWYPIIDKRADVR